MSKPQLSHYQSSSSSLSNTISRYCIGIATSLVLLIIITAPSGDHASFLTNTNNWWLSASSEKGSDIVQGVTFILDTPKTEQEQASVDSAITASFTGFNLQVTKCFSRLTKTLLLFELTDSVKQFVHKQIVQKRRSLEDASLDDQHEEWVIKPWKFIEKSYPLENKVIRATTACFRGGGLGKDKPHSESHWSERAGGAGQAHHPLFFPLHGGVSPRRVVLHSLRSSEYLGVPSVEARIVDSSMLHPAKGGWRIPNPVSQQNQEVPFSLKQDVVSSSSTISSSSSSSNAPRVVVDLGCGHGAMLAAMCPPHPRLWCYGVDFTEALIERGKRAFKHLDLRPGVSAPHLPTGHADAVLSNGVAGVIRLSHNCLHIQEMLRLLKPGKGIGLMWHLSTTRWARFHPSFFASVNEEFFLNETRFSQLPLTAAGATNSKISSSSSALLSHDSPKIPVSDEDFVPDWGKVMIDPFFDILNVDEANNINNNNENEKKSSSSSAFPDRILKTEAHKVLSRCPGKLGRYISRIDIIAGDVHAPLYTPSWGSHENTLRHWPGTFGARLFRNTVPFDEERAMKQTDNQGKNNIVNDEKKTKKQINNNQKTKGDDNNNAGYPETLHPPLGLELMHSPPSSSSSNSSSSFFVWMRERTKYRYALDVALKCEYHEKGQGWCPKERVQLEV